MRMHLKRWLLAGFLMSLLLLPSHALAQKFKMSARSEYWIMNYLEGEFDKKYGLEAEPVQFASGVEVVEALMAGSVQFATAGHIPLTTLLTKTKNVLVLGSCVSNDGSIYKLIVGKKSPYKTIQDLKGKRIATRIGSGPYQAFVNYINSQGLKEKDFRILNSRPTEIIAAMEAGSVEGGVWFQPLTSIMRWKGYGRMLTNFDGHARSQGHWIVNRQFAEKHPDIVVRVLAGVVDSQRLMTNNPRVAARLIAQGFAKRGRKFPPEVFLMGLPEWDYDPVIKTRHIAEFRKAFQFMKARGRLKGPEPNWGDVIRDDFMQKALALSHKTNKQY